MLKKKKDEALQNIIISVAAILFIAILVAASMIRDSLDARSAGK